MVLFLNSNHSGRRLWHSPEASCAYMLFHHSSVVRVWHSQLHLTRVEMLQSSLCLEPAELAPTVISLVWPTSAVHAAGAHNPTSPPPQMASCVPIQQSTWAIVVANMSILSGLDSHAAKASCRVWQQAYDLPSGRGSCCCRCYRYCAGSQLPPGDYGKTSGRGQHLIPCFVSCLSSQQSQLT